MFRKIWTHPRMLRYKSDRHEKTVQWDHNEIQTTWWKPFFPKIERNNIKHSNKLMLLFSILAECEACGEKLLVFSPSLLSLDLIEPFLKLIDENTRNPNPKAKLGGFTGNWKRNFDYLRLDGDTNAKIRDDMCEKFNKDKQVRFVFQADCAR